MKIGAALFLSLFNWVLAPVGGEKAIPPLGLDVEEAEASERDGLRLKTLD